MATDVEAHQARFEDLRQEYAKRIRVVLPDPFIQCATCGAAVVDTRRHQSWHQIVG